MAELTLLTGTERLLGQVITELDDTDMDAATNCPPWTVRDLASHALKNQLFWAGLVTGRDLMDQEEAMAAVPYPGTLGPIAAEVTALVVELWHSEGVLSALHVTPFGELPGSVVVDFAVVDAAAHAWDLSASLGRPVEFPAAWVPGLTEVVEHTCTEHAVELGLVKAPVEPPVGATPTQRLMAAAGRTVPVRA